MVAVKSAGVAAALSSVKLATGSLKAVPAATLKSTGMAVMVVAPARPASAARRIPAASAASALVFDCSQPLRMVSSLVPLDRSVRMGAGHAQPGGGHQVQPIWMPKQYTRGPSATIAKSLAESSLMRSSGMARFRIAALVAGVAACLALGPPPPPVSADPQPGPAPTPPPPPTPPAPPKIPLRLLPPTPPPAPRTAT